MSKLITAYFARLKHRTYLIHRGLFLRAISNQMLLLSFIQTHSVVSVIVKIYKNKITTVFASVLVKVISYGWLEFLGYLKASFVALIK